MENISFPGQIFRWKKDHPGVQNFVKTVYSVTKEETEEHKHTEKPDFPSSYNQVIEGECQLDESKAPDWMDAEIKTKEFDISIDGRPKMARVGDYWSDKKTMEIVDLLKEYQDVFTHDYKYLKGLVQEMGEMKIELLPGAKPIKKRPYKLAHKYKPIIQKEIKAMLTANIIYPIDKLEWESPWSCNLRNTTQKI
jgi:hypothetical protein